MKIEDINGQIKALNKLKKILMVPIHEDDLVEEIIFKKYIELESVSKVAEHINNIGYRISSNSGSRKYIANDISYIIKDKNIKFAKNEFKNIAIRLFNSHKRAKW